MIEALLLLIRPGGGVQQLSPMAFPALPNPGMLIHRNPYIYRVHSVAYKEHGRMTIPIVRVVAHDIDRAALADHLGAMAAQGAQMLQGAPQSSVSLLPGHVQDAEYEEQPVAEVVTTNDDEVDWLP